MSQYYFNLIPKELNYIILSLLDYYAFQNSNGIITKFNEINYEILFRYKFPNLYYYVNDIINDYIRRHEYDREYIFDRMYLDLLLRKYNEIDFELFYTHIQKDRSSITDITNDILDSIKLKLISPTMHQKLDWFPKYPNVMSLIVKFVNSTIYIIDQSLDEFSALGPGYTKNFTNFTNLKEYIITGKIKDKIIFDGMLSEATPTFDSLLILTFMMIKEYLNGNNKIMFMSDFTGLDPDELITIVKENMVDDDEDDEYHEYEIYMEHRDFFTEISRFIKDNIKKLKYID